MIDLNQWSNGPEYLAHLRKIYGEVLGKPLAAKDVIDAWESWEKSGTSKPDELPYLANNPLATFNAYLEDILHTCSDLMPVEASEINFAILPTRSMNAYANTLPNGDKIIVLDNQLIATLNEIIIMVILTVYGGLSDEKIDLNTAYILQVFDGFLLGDKNAPNKDLFFDSIQADYELVEIGSYFGMAFITFILCHELSHHICGHSSLKKAVDINTQNGAEGELVINNPHHEQEFEADSYGYKLFLAMIERREQGKIVQLAEAFNRAPLIFFEIIELLVYRAEQLGISIGDSDTHPKPSERKKHLQRQYEADLHIHGVELYEGFMDFSRSVLV